MTLDLRMAERDWSALRKQFQSSFRGYMAPETGALAVLGERRSDDHHEFIVTNVLLPGPGALKVAHSGALVFDSSFIRRAHRRMRKAGLAGIACFHTHPGCDERVKFSDYDDEQEPLLFANLKELEPRTHLISVVAGKRSQFGRVYVGDRMAMPMSRLVVVGEHLQYLTLDGRTVAAPPQPSGVFDSSLAITGSGAMSMLSRMRVAVVGASGTGSLFCELLARAGCRRILAYRPGHCENTELESHPAYAAEGCRGASAEGGGAAAGNRGAGPWVLHRARPRHYSRRRRAAAGRRLRPDCRLRG